MPALHFIRFSCISSILWLKIGSICRLRRPTLAFWAGGSVRFKTRDASRSTSSVSVPRLQKTQARMPALHFIRFSCISSILWLKIGSICRLRRPTLALWAGVSARFNMRDASRSTSSVSVPRLQKAQARMPALHFIRFSCISSILWLKIGSICRLRHPMLALWAGSSACFNKKRAGLRTCPFAFVESSLWESWSARGKRM